MGARLRVLIVPVVSRIRHDSLGTMTHEARGTMADDLVPAFTMGRPAISGGTSWVRPLRPA